MSRQRVLDQRAGRVAPELSPATAATLSGGADAAITIGVRAKLAGGPVDRAGRE